MPASGIQQCKWMSLVHAGSKVDNLLGRKDDLQCLIIRCVFGEHLIWAMMSQPAELLLTYVVRC